jgi:O-antigen ligase
MVLMMSFLLPALVVLVPLLITPGVLFHYDSVPKIALTSIAMSLVLLRPWELANDLNRLWRSKAGRWLCLLAVAQIVWSGIATIASSRVAFSLFGSNWRRLGLITIIALAVLVVSATAHLLRKPATVTAIFRATAAAAVGVSVYAIAQYFNVDPWQNAQGYRALDGDLTIVRPPGTLGHADYLGWWLAIAAFFAWAAYRTEQRTWRWMALAGTVLSGVAIVLSGTRSAIVAAGAGVLYLLASRRARLNRRHWWPVAGIVAASFVFYISPAGEKLRARVQWSSDEAPGGSRPLLWRDALKMGTMRPVTGFGPETFAAAFPKFQSEALARLVPDFYHESPHNVALDALTSEGLPGLLLSGAWLALGIFAVVRRRNKTDVVDAALAAAFTASFAASLFNSMTIGPAVATLVLIAMLIARRAAHVPERVQPAARGPLILSAGFALPVAGVLAGFGVLLLYSDYKLERFSRAAAAGDPAVAVIAYYGLPTPVLRGAADDLYCSRRLASNCGAGTSVIARLQCSQAATRAAARAISTADNPPNAWYNLAMFAAAHNDGRGAEKALRTAEELAPNWFRPLWALANYFTVSGHPNEARTEMERALYLNAGKDKELRDSLRTVAQAR